MNQDNELKTPGPIKRFLLQFAGWLAVSLGVIGIFLPLLPTTPFLLLAAACFMRSSPSVYHWLVEHPQLGRFIKSFLHGRGLPLKAKIYAVSLIWLSIGSTVIWLVPIFTVKILLLAIAAGVTYYLIKLPTFKDSET